MIYAENSSKGRLIQSQDSVQRYIEVVRLLVNLVEPKEGMSVCDPACGSGGILIESVKYISKHGGNPRNLVLEGPGYQPLLLACNTVDGVNTMLAMTSTLLVVIF